MGIFDKKVPTSGGFGIRPLSTDRIAAFFDKEEVNYGREEDGHIYCSFDGHPFRFFARGENDEIFACRAWWRPEPPVDMWNEILAACNEWHSDRYFPKVYVERHENSLYVVTETNIDLEHGVTDDQLDQFLTCAIGTAGQVFSFLEEKFPQFESWVPPESD